MAFNDSADVSKLGFSRRYFSLRILLRYQSAAIKVLHANRNMVNRPPVSSCNRALEQRHPNLVLPVTRILAEQQGAIAAWQHVQAVHFPSKFKDDSQIQFDSEFRVRNNHAGLPVPLDVSVNPVLNLLRTILVLEVAVNAFLQVSPCPARVRASRK
jgi:hypothetical protein